MEKIKNEEKEITFEKLEILSSRGTERIKNTALYNKIEEFVNKYYPEREFPNGEKHWVFYFPCKDESEGKEYLIPFYINRTIHGDFWVKIRTGETFLIEREGDEKNKKEELLSLLISKAMEIQGSLTKEEIESKVLYRYAWIKIKKQIRQVLDVDIPEEKLLKVVRWEELPVPKPKLEVRE